MLWYILANENEILLKSISLKSKCDYIYIFVTNVMPYCYSTSCLLNIYCINSCLMYSWRNKIYHLFVESTVRIISTPKKDNPYWWPCWHINSWTNCWCPVAKVNKYSWFFLRSYCLYNCEQWSFCLYCESVLKP